MGVDVLVSGHTHEMKIEKGDDGGLLVNPGTGTGAPNVLEVEAPPPSFVLMDVQGPRIVTYSYTLVDEVRIARAGMCEKEMVCICCFVYTDWVVVGLTCRFAVLGGKSGSRCLR